MRPELRADWLTGRDCILHDATPTATILTRRLLQSTLGGVAGLTVWSQGWTGLRHAMAQKNALSGQMTWAVHVNIAPTWFDPAETLSLITPYMS
jgi:hypothetical protein